MVKLVCIENRLLNRNFTIGKTYEADFRYNRVMTDWGVYTFGLDKETLVCGNCKFKLAGSGLTPTPIFKALASRYGSQRDVFSSENGICVYSGGKGDNLCL